MLVKEIMSKDITSISGESTLMEAASLMCLYRYSGIPVVEDGELLGLIAEKDVLAQLFPSLDDAMQGMAAIDFDAKINEYKSLMNNRISQHMTTNVKSVDPEMPILKAAIIMANNRFRRIPVTDGKTLVGMVSLGDIHKAIFHQSIKSSNPEV